LRYHGRDEPAQEARVVQEGGGVKHPLLIVLALASGLAAFAAIGHVSEYIKRTRPRLWEEMNLPVPPWRDSSAFIVTRWLRFVFGEKGTSLCDSKLTARIWFARSALCALVILLVGAKFL
jgi:hypothetical protein